MNFVDEQSGERCHKRHKFSRPHLSRKTSAEDNLMDMMREALTWSDPKMSYLAYRSYRAKIEKKCDIEMIEYFDQEKEEIKLTNNQSYTESDKNSGSDENDSSDSESEDNLSDDEDSDSI